MLDEAPICHVGFVVEAQPFVLPSIHARIGDRLYLHGANTNRMLGTLRGGAPVCVTVTLLDGLVLARSAFHHSLNYRSVVILGIAEEVMDPAEKAAALDALVDHVLPAGLRKQGGQTETRPARQRFSSYRSTKHPQRCAPAARATPPKTCTCRSGQARCRSSSSPESRFPSPTSRPARKCRLPSSG
jgi:nitroimidazol reductase NimA-like FMN-containing flavoprotein (pyridoxamine 5'-phosphate oxidase superfamily)